jgi:hypothetical protein
MKKQLYLLIVWTLFVVRVSAVAQSEVAPVPDRKWELGLRISHLQQFSYLHADDDVYVDRSGGGMQLQAFGLRYIQGNRFLRAAAGISYHQFEFTSIVEANQTGLHHWSKDTRLHTELGMGYEFPLGSRLIANRLKFRVGFSVAYVQNLQSEGGDLSYIIDSASITPSGLISIDRSTYSGITPAVFFQFEVRLVQQLYLGLEWREGPTFSYSSSRYRDLDGQSFGSSNTAFSWNPRIGTPLFSIGYSF